VNLNDVPHAIQLALGPVFLLTAIASTLNVLAGRLARIIDRARYLNEQPQAAQSLAEHQIEAELKSLETRRKWTSGAVTFCTLGALLDCMVILVLFLEAALGIGLKWLAGGMFAGSTLALVVGLSFFLREVYLAGSTIRIIASHRHGAQPPT
jgi:hypothetical protein